MQVLRSRPRRLIHSAIAGHSFFAGSYAWQSRPSWIRPSNRFASQSSPPTPPPSETSDSTRDSSDSSSSNSSSTKSLGDAETTSHAEDSSMPPGWDDNPDYGITKFSELPSRQFGYNQHMVINAEFKEALRQVLWQFRAPIRYAFAYGSGVFPQTTTVPADLGASPHPNPPEAVRKWQTHGYKVIDFIFGVSYSQHWHSLNLQQHRDHYSFLGSLGSNVVSRVQDRWGAGAYFNPFINVNGIMIKYGVVNLDTIHRDLSEWDTLYIAGRLQKPVKILRDDPKIRLANQVNLISALRTALLMLPESFTEAELYEKIAGISYMGDLRMTFRAEDPNKIRSIVESQMPNFRQLYTPLVENLPNVMFNDATTHESGWMHSTELNARLVQDMDPAKRGNMVRRLPKAFRAKMYNRFRGTYELSTQEYEGLMRDTSVDDPKLPQVGGEFERRIAREETLPAIVGEVVKKTVTWPTYSQTFKGILTAGPVRGWKYYNEKKKKGKDKAAETLIASKSKKNTQKVGGGDAEKS